MSESINEGEKSIVEQEEAANDFLQNFFEFKDTSEFLEMPQKSLETVLSCDQLPLDEMKIFDCVSRWAEHQCQQKGIESTGENFREVLGSCFQKIRYPTMKLDDFTKISVIKTNLFTLEETAAIFQLLGTDEDQKAKFDKSQLLFETKPRCSHSHSLSVLRLPKQFKIIQKPKFFACHGGTWYNMFQVNQKISLHGVGFLGPVEGDTRFDVTVQIKRFVNSFVTFDSGTFKKNIVARKGNIFYFLFDAPITIEPNAFDGRWLNRYTILYSVKGTNNVSQFKVKNPQDESVQISGVEFTLNSGWNHSFLAELLFKQN